MPPRYAGQILRIIGLLIEMFGLAAFAMSPRGGAGNDRGWLGLTTDQIWLIVIVGFVVWLTGTITIHATAPGGRLAHRRPADRDESRKEL